VSAASECSDGRPRNPAAVRACTIGDKGEIYIKDVGGAPLAGDGEAKQVL
jgi:hypothetical protein